MLLSTFVKSTIRSIVPTSAYSLYVDKTATKTGYTVRIKVEGYIGDINAIEKIVSALKEKLGCYCKISSGIGIYYDRILIYVSIKTDRSRYAKLLSMSRTTRQHRVYLDGRWEERIRVVRNCRIKKLPETSELWRLVLVYTLAQDGYKPCNRSEVSAFGTLEEIQTNNLE